MSLLLTAVTIQLQCGLRSAGRLSGGRRQGVLGGEGSQDRVLQSPRAAGAQPASERAGSWFDTRTLPRGARSAAPELRRRVGRLGREERGVHALREVRQVDGVRLPGRGAEGPVQAL